MHILGALERFFTALALSKDEVPTPKPIKQSTSKRSQEVEAELDRLGIRGR